MSQAIDFSCFLGAIDEYQVTMYKKFIVSFGISIDFPVNINEEQLLMQC